jgi:DNA-binding CsgD family transcriptional regulator
MLEAFSRSLDTLYRLSEQVPPNLFRLEALRLLRTLISFDGAILKVGTIVVSFKRDALVELEHAEKSHACVFEKCVLDRTGPAIGFANGDAVPLICNRNGMGGELRHSDRCKFAHEYGAKSVLLFGKSAEVGLGQSWIVLFRENEHEFNENEASMLQHYWRHILQATAFNLDRTLNQRDASRNLRTMGLLNSKGILEIADAELVTLIKQEWPNVNGDHIPIEAVDELFANNVYQGKHIEIVAFTKFGYLVCEARPISVFHLLAPTEKKVASLFASGITHSQIAQQLGVSRYTVRNQLTQIYQKLEIHSKAELTKIFSRMQTHPQA